MRVNEILKNERVRLEAMLKESLQKSQIWDERLWLAMDYSLQAGGKRLRPLFLKLAYEACGGKEEGLAEPFMQAMEMIHTYSLIHDDLPAMDDDDLRRGRPTCHKAFDEATAILAGDGLLNLAYETMMNAAAERMAGGELADLQVGSNMIRAARVIGECAGPSGMVAGQTADILAEQQTASREHLEFIEEKKTGCLIVASLLAGGELAGADEEQKKALYQAGRAFGKAFQIQDDILDIEGDTALLGKAVGQDEKMEKVTFVTLYGMEEAKRQVADLSHQAQEALAIFDSPSGKILSQWIGEMISRQY